MRRASLSNLRCGFGDPRPFTGELLGSESILDRGGRLDWLDRTGRASGAYDVRIPPQIWPMAPPSGGERSAGDVRGRGPPNGSDRPQRPEERDRCIACPEQRSFRNAKEEYRV